VKIKKLLLIGIIGLLLILIALPIAGCKTSEPAEAKTLRIGDLQSFTGFISGLGIQAEREIQTYAEIVNEGGGITVNGQKYLIELVPEDYKSDLDGTAAAARKLAYDEQVKFSTGPTAFFCIASIPVFEQAKVLHVEAYNILQPTELNPDIKYGFLGYVSTLGHLIATMKGTQMAFPNVKKIAIVYPDDGSQLALMPKLTKISNDLGFTIVGDTVYFPNEMVDYSPIGAQLNAIKDVDAYVLGNGLIQHMVGIIKSLRALGNTKPFIIATTQDCKILKEAIGEDDATSIMTIGIGGADADNPPIMAETISRCEAKYGVNPRFYNNANSLYVLLEVIEKAQSLDVDKVKDTWESMDTIDTMFGPGTMGGLETYGIKHAVGHPLPLQKLNENGEFSYVGWVDVTIP
jgi:branched-chain amino acid transport system substrate-binding protein